MCAPPFLKVAIKFVKKEIMQYSEIAKLLILHNKVIELGLIQEIS